ncbi:hypothetical protein GCM10009573_00340 [Agromyces bracchium]
MGHASNNIADSTYTHLSSNSEGTDALDAAAAQGRTLLIAGRGGVAPTPTRVELAFPRVATSEEANRQRMPVSDNTGSLPL